MIIYRRNLKHIFSKIEFNGLNVADYTVYVNGSITEYYKADGIYKPIYKKAKKEISLDLCINTSDINLSTILFMNQLSNKFTESVEIISGKLKAAGFQLDAEQMKSNFDHAHSLTLQAIN